MVHVSQNSETTLPILMRLFAIDNPWVIGFQLKLVFLRSYHQGGVANFLNIWDYASKVKVFASHLISYGFDPRKGYIFCSFFLICFFLQLMLTFEEFNDTWVLRCPVFEGEIPFMGVRCRT